MSRYYIPIYIFLRPFKTWMYILNRVNLKFSVIYMLILASIGPIFSFYNIHFIENFPIQKALTYSLTTYFLDTSFSFLFAYILTIILKIDFEKALKISIFSQTAIWLSDIVDISQYLRPLSNIGLALSLYSLYFVLKKILNIELKYIAVLIAIFLILYSLNAFISEMIFTNPYLKMILKG